MKKSNKRKNGFTLLEVIISIAIISIISTSIYTGYTIMIKQTKSGQVKQASALEGKKVIEGLEAASFSASSNRLTVNDMNFNRINSDFVRYLNDKYEEKEENGDAVTEAAAKYIETITLAPTVASQNGVTSNIKLTNEDTNAEANKLYIYKGDLGADKISYWEYDKDDQFNPQKDSGEEISVLSGSDGNKNKVRIFVYLTPKPEDSTVENVEVLDYKGSQLTDNFTKGINNNLIFNFEYYKEENGNLPSDEEMEINVYNKDLVPANVYLEKQKDLNIVLKPCKGEIKVYDNRSINTNQEYGTLYNIKVQIEDNKKNVLFTGYYKKNIHL